MAQASPGDCNPAASDAHWNAEDAISSDESVAYTPGNDKFVSKYKTTLDQQSVSWT